MNYKTIEKESERSRNRKTDDEKTKVNDKATD